MQNRVGQAGAGIVADSDPEAEFQGTRNKARGLLKAIEITEERVRPRFTTTWESTPNM